MITTKLAIAVAVMFGNADFQKETLLDQMRIAAGKAESICSQISLTHSARNSESASSTLPANAAQPIASSELTESKTAESEVTSSETHTVEQPLAAVAAETTEAVITETGDTAVTEVAEATETAQAIESAEVAAAGGTIAEEILTAPLSAVAAVETAVETAVDAAVSEIAAEVAVESDGTADTDAIIEVEAAPLLAAAPVETDVQPVVDVPQQIETQEVAESVNTVSEKTDSLPELALAETVVDQPVLKAAPMPILDDAAACHVVAESCDFAAVDEPASADHSAAELVTADLSRIQQAWPSLDQQTRDAILLLVRADTLLHSTN